MLKVVILLILFLGVSELHAARSSSRNLKSLSQQDVEDKQQDSQDLEFAGGEHIQRDFVRITFLGPKNGWGFVTKDCAFYSPEGKNMGYWKAGTLFKYNDILPSSKHDMLLSIIRKKGGWTEPCLLPCDCIAAYDGDPEKVNIEIVANLRKYFLLSGKVERHKGAILKKEYQKNPFYGLYQQSVIDYKASIDVANQMLQEANKLTGLRKTKADEELRKYKYKQAQLQSRMNDVAQQYRGWKSNNPVDLLKIRDSELERLSSEMESVKNKVANLLPHEET